MEHSLGFEGHMVSVTTIQLGYSRKQPWTDNT